MEYSAFRSSVSQAWELPPSASTTSVHTRLDDGLVYATLSLPPIHRAFTSLFQYHVRSISLFCDPLCLVFYLLLVVNTRPELRSVQGWVAGARGGACAAGAE
jgi:hypothetical protein